MDDLLLDLRELVSELDLRELVSELRRRLRLRPSRCSLLL